MTHASDLIERVERETGQRIDSNDGDNMAMAGLIGAMSRILGHSPPSYRERDDVVAGVVVRHQMSDEYKRQQERDALIAEMLVNGASPDDLGKLLQ